MGKRIQKPHLQENTFRKNVERAKELDDRERESFVISLRQFDKSQGQDFSHWEEMRILSQAMEVLYNYSHKPINQQFSDRFKPYSSFPPDDKTKFKYPEHISRDAQWACLHVQGKPCLIGHIFKNTFFLVFLDSEHHFWLSELKNT